MSILTDTGSMVILLAMLPVVLLIYMLFRRIRTQDGELVKAQRKIEDLTANLNAICSGAVGVDRRVSKLERQGRDITSRQESMEAQTTDDRPYGEAINLVHKGADASRLVDELGLTQSEAELVAMLHGMDKTG